MRILGILLLLVAVPALADEAAFRSLDLDGDGFVSLAEAAGYEDIVVRFDRADRNRDGKLSLKEFENLKNIKVRVAKSKKEPRTRTVARSGSAAAGGTTPTVP